MEVKPYIVDGEIMGISVDGKRYNPDFIINWVPQSSTWILIMVVHIDGCKWHAPEYSNSPLLTEDVLTHMCKWLTESLRQSIDKLV